MILMHQSLACHLTNISTHFTNGRIIHATLQFDTTLLHIVGVYGVSAPGSHVKDAIFSDTAHSLNELLASIGPQPCIVCTDSNSVKDPMDRQGGVLTTYDKDARSVCHILGHKGYSDCYRERHATRCDFSFYQQQQGKSRIDSIWISSQLRQLLRDEESPSAIASNTGGLTIDHRPVATRLKIGLQVDTKKTIAKVIAMGKATRPRRVKMGENRRSQANDGH